MKKNLVVRFLSFALAASTAFSQGVTSYAANLTDDVLILADDETAAEDTEAASSEDTEEVETSESEVTESESETKSEDTENTESDDVFTEESDDVEVSASQEEVVTEALPEEVQEFLDVDYEVSELEKELKEKSAEHDSVEELRKLTEGVDYAKDELVTLVESKEKAEEIAQIYGGVLKSYTNHVAVISLAGSDLNVEEAVSYGMDEDYTLPYVEPNYIITIDDPTDSWGDTDDLFMSHYIPSGNAFSDRWWNDNYNDPFLNPEDVNHQWFHQAINTYAAWGVTTGNPEITVGVIDSGFNVDHTEFAGHYRFVKDAELGINDFENGLTDAVGHGTHVAGIIGAALNDDLGAGVAPNVTLLPIKVATESGGVNVDLIYNALMYVGDLTVEDESISIGERRADIINISIGGTSYNALYEMLIDGVHDAGVTTVVAMGNYSSNKIQYPASFDNVIAVCSTNQSGQLSHFSSFGSWADISAPGSKIFSCDIEDDNGYVYKDGTSMASPVVAGACALYMSAVGHVDPDTMKRVIQSSVTGSAGKDTGAGILDLAKMFNGDTTAPRISLMAGDDTVISEVQDGANYNVAVDVDKAAYLNVTPLNFGGDAAGNANTRIVYTTDGTNPSVSNGEVTNGILYNQDVSIKVSDIVGDITDKTKVTIKAMAVTGMGVAGKVTTINFTVDPQLTGVSDALDTGKTVEITDAPMSIVAGKSHTFTAAVRNSDNSLADSQKVIWRIESYYGGDLSKCKINSATGALTTVAGKTGTLVISCSTEDSLATDYVNVNIVDIYPVNAMTIATEDGNKSVNLKMTLSEDKLSVVGEEDLVVLTKLTDTKNNNLLDTDSYYSYQHISFAWSSSNTNVAIVEDATGFDEAPCANVTAVGAGSAVITLKALDGSGKTAKINVKVTSDVKASSVTIKDATDPENIKNVTALTTYVGAEGALLNSVIAYPGDLTNLTTPTWTTSNKKVVSVTADGATATLVPHAKGTATITCAATDGSNKKATLKVTVREYVSSISISGQKYVSKGGNATLTATVLPATADNKKLKWEIVDNPDPTHVSINATNGKITVKKDTTLESDAEIVVRATALDDGAAVSELFTVAIKDKATSVTAAVDEGYSKTIATKTAGQYKNKTIIVGNADNDTDVAFTSSNPKVATVTYEGNVATVTAVSKGTAKITVAAQDGSGKKATVDIKVVQPLESIKITGQANIARGNKATFKAAVLPATANDKTVNWFVLDEHGNAVSATAGITVNNGNVSVAKDAEVGKTYIVVAAARDGGQAACTAAQFTVTDTKASSVTVSAVDSTVINRVHVPAYSKGSLTSIRLYDTNIPDSDGNLETQVDLTNKVFATVNKVNNDITDSVSVAWTSSNNNVAKVTDNGDGTVTVKAVKAGSANLICTAQDGSGKKATVKLTVITPASGVEITPPRGLIQTNNCGMSYLAFGKSSASVAQLEKAYGKPSVSKVNWDYKVGFRNQETYEYFAIPDEYMGEIKKTNAFGSFSNGKLTAGTATKVVQGMYKYMNAAMGVEPDDLTDDGSYYGDICQVVVTIIATTTDGTEYSDSFEYGLTLGTSKISFATYSGSFKVSGNKCTIDCGSANYKRSLYPIYVNTDGAINSFVVSSSNPKVATAYMSGKVLVVGPEGKGTTTITVTAKDGTNKKATITITVK